MNDSTSKAEHSDALSDFITQLKTNTYPFLGEHYPEDWHTSNIPTSMIWDDSCEQTLAIYWIDDISIELNSVEIQSKLRSVEYEYVNYPENYPSGLLMAVAMKIDQVADLGKIDSKLASSDDIVILTLLYGKIYKLDLAQI